MVVKIFVLSLLISLLLMGCSSTKTQQVEPKRTVVSGLQVGTVEKQMLGGYEVAGNVKASRATVVAPQTTGRVTAVLVREGEHVSQGQVMVVLDAPDAAQRTSGAGQQVMAAAATRQLADTTYERTFALYQSDAVSKQELDRALAAKQSAAAEEARARAGFSEAQAVEGYLTLRAPYSGQVTRQLAEVGMLVAMSQPLVNMEDSSQYEVEAWVDVAQAEKVRPNTDVNIIRNDGTVQAGKVLYVSPGATTEGRSFFTKISLAGNGWQTGEYVRVRFPFAAAQQLTVPVSAIQERGQLTGVYVVGQDNVLSYRLIRAGRIFGARAEVLSGLAGDERIVVVGVEQAVDGGLWKGDAP